MSDATPKPQPATPAGGFPVSEFADESAAALTRVLGVETSRKGPYRRKRALAALAQALADGSRWDAWLADVPAAGLLVLELLTEIGGGADCQSLADVLEQRRLPANAATDAVLGLCSRGLIVPLSRAGDSEISAVCPYAESLPVLEERVRGVSLPARPEILTRENTSTPGTLPLRRMLTVATLTAHRPLRFTVEGAAHRSSLRPFARGLGPDTQEIGDLVDQAAIDELLDVRDAHFRPRAERLSAAIRDGRQVSEAGRWLEPGEWISLESLTRATLRAGLDLERPGLVKGNTAPVAYSLYPRLNHLRQQLLDAPGVERFEAGDETWLRRRARPAEPSGDGHVTPSFEVILGPDADLELVLTVGLGCELQRLDRMLTFRITKESVAAGLAAGLEPGQLRAALDAVGRHPVPGNVARLVDEWERSTRIARVEQGWFLFIGTEAQASLEASPLAPHLRGCPAPGVLRLARTTPRELLATTLSEQDLDLSLSYPMGDATDQRDTDTLDPSVTMSRLDDLDGPFGQPAPSDDTPIDAPPWPLDPSGTPELRERIEQARATGFAPPAHPPEDHQRTQALAFTTAPGDEPVLGPGQGGEGIELFQSLQECMAQLRGEAGRELARFARKLAEPERLGFEVACELGGPLLPFLALRPKWRRRVANEASQMHQLLELALEHLERGRTNPVGERALALLAHPAVADYLDAAEDPFFGEEDGLDDEDPEFVLDYADRRPSIHVAFDGAGHDDEASPPSSVIPPRASPPPATHSTPTPDAFRELDRADLMAALAAAAEHQHPIYLLRERRSSQGRARGHEVRHVYLERIVLTGGRQVLLTSDYETGEDHAFPVREIRSLLRD